MTKALLTAKDIEIFINSAVSDITYNEPQFVNKAKLMKLFDLSYYKYSKYMKQGMPYIYNKRKYRFNIKVVENWLLKHK